MTILALLIMLWLLPSLVFVSVAMLAIPGGLAARKLRRAASTHAASGVGELGR